MKMFSKNLKKLPTTQKKSSMYSKKWLTVLEKNVGGIRKLKWPVGAIVIVDVGKEILRSVKRMRWVFLLLLLLIQIVIHHWLIM